MQIKQKTKKKDVNKVERRMGIDRVIPHNVFWNKYKSPIGDKQQLEYGSPTEGDFDNAFVSDKTGNLDIAQANIKYMKDMCNRCLEPQQT